ncbi:MAG: hypothetical protein PHS41_01225 [Victivallaceae bacterium]|nr:hypothetical protein [Victivallaceae bacterium]
MHIENYTDATQNCRFCFMCRHLSGIGNVTFTEADTPRVRASMIYGITLHPEKLSEPDFIDTIYRSDLSAACRFHCVSHFDENGLNLAARADIVEAGLAPEYVKVIAEELKQSAKWSSSGQGNVLYFEDRYTSEAKTVSAAFRKIMKKAQIPYMTIQGGCIGKALAVLGFGKDAKEVTQAFAAAVNATGAKTLVVSNPAAYDALTSDFPTFGAKLNAKVQHTSEYLASLKLKVTQKAPAVYYLESDFLKNYDGNLPGPRALLKAMGAKVLPFGTNNEESYTCAEGAVVLPKIDATLVEKLAHYVAARADHPDEDVIAVASPYTKIQLEKYTKLQVKTLEELFAAAL